MVKKLFSVEYNLTDKSICHIVQIIAHYLQEFNLLIKYLVYRVQDVWLTMLLYGIYMNWFFSFRFDKVFEYKFCSELIIIDKIRCSYIRRYFK